MSKLIRKINRNNWPDELSDISAIGADAITQCMRTKGNAMSVFEISSEDLIDEAFLALASNALVYKLETFDVVAMEPEHISALGLNLIQTLGQTTVESLRKTHYDIPDICYGKLGPIAYHIFECVQHGHVTRRTKGELKKIIRKAVTECRLDPTTLSDGVQQDIGCGH